MLNSINQTTAHLTQLRNSVVYSAIEGNFKKYKTAAKECAEYTLDNYELAKKTKAPQIKVPLFSRIGLNMMKIWFLNLFRNKSPAEKKLKKMLRSDAMRDYAAKFIK